MFGKMMNNFYYGKSGKGDFRPEDLPKNRTQLFGAMLRVRFSGLCRLNLMSIIAFLPIIIVLGSAYMNWITGMNTFHEYAQALEKGDVSAFTQEQIAFFAKADINAFVQAIITQTCLWLIPAILITGPIQAGMAYVTRNWARDEHSFIWSDFKDAVKDNWKQALGVSAITSLLPLIANVCWNFYGQMAVENSLFVIPQMLTLSLALVWVLGMTFMYPVMVGYKMKFKDLIKNSILISIARLPQTIGIRLLLVLLTGIVVGLVFYTSIGIYAMLVLVTYYLLIGFAMSRFIIASYANAMFDKYINPYIQGAQVNRGLSKEEDYEDDDEESETQKNEIEAE